MTTRDEIERAVNGFETAVKESMAMHYLIDSDESDCANARQKRDAARDRLLALLSPARPDGDVTISEAMVKAGARAAWIAEIGFDRAAPTSSEWAFCLDQARVILNAALAAARDRPGGEEGTDA